MLEGVTFALRHNIDAGVKSAARLDERLVVVGGAARSDLWMQIIADVTARPVFTIAQEVEAAMGAALLAAYGVGLVGADDVRRGWVDLAPRATPDPAATRRYEPLYETYKSLYPALRTDHARPERPGHRGTQVGRARHIDHNRKDRSMNAMRRMLVVALSMPLLGAAAPAALAADAAKTINIGYFPVVSPVPIMQSQKQLEAKGYTVNWVPITPGTARCGERAGRRQARHRAGATASPPW